VGCTKTAIVKTNITPKGSGQVIGEGEYEVGTTVNLQLTPFAVIFYMLSPIFNYSPLMIISAIL
jgi:hypothetical protein